MILGIETDLGVKNNFRFKKKYRPRRFNEKTIHPYSFRSSFACNFNILIDGHPRVMGIKEILHEWTKFRINCIRRRTQYDINKKSEKRHLLLGLEKILLDIDKAIKIIRETEKEKEVITNLMKGFKIVKSS